MKVVIAEDQQVAYYSFLMEGALTFAWFFFYYSCLCKQVLLNYCSHSSIRQIHKSRFCSLGISWRGGMHSFVYTESPTHLLHWINTSNTSLFITWGIRCSPLNLWCSDACLDFLQKNPEKYIQISNTSNFSRSSRMFKFGRRYPLREGVPWRIQ